MKKRRVSLALKMYILIISIILSVSVLLLIISNVAYRGAVFAPYPKQLQEAGIPDGELTPYMEHFSGFLGTEELQRAREQMEGDEQAFFTWLGEQPPLENSMLEDYEQPSLMVNLLVVYSTLENLRANLDATDVSVEIVKDGTVYHICRSSKNNMAESLSMAEFGMEGSLTGLPAENFATADDYASDGKYGFLRCVSYPMNGGEYRVWMAYDITPLKEDYYGFLNRSILSVLILTAVVSVISLLLTRKFLIKPVRSLAQAATEFTPEADGTYSTDKISRVEVRTTDEIGDLSREIRSMQERIVEDTGSLARMTSERERISTELDLARKIQAYMLPDTFPAFPDRKEFDLYAMMQPARAVGGDFYDFFLIDDDHLAVVIADVSGKGIPAAMFMMVAMALIKNQMLSSSDPALALERVNRQICDRNRSNTFVTVWLAVLELSTGKGTACNAGHENPCVRRAGGAFEMLTYKHDLIVGALPDVRYHIREFELQPGDCLFVYTDGVAEASNAENELFGTQRLTDTLNQCPETEPEKMVHSVYDAVNRFADNTPQFDDITMLCLKYRGSGGSAE